MVALKKMHNEVKSVKSRFFRHFSGNSPVNRFAQACSKPKLFSGERAQKTTSENGQIAEVLGGAIC